MENTFVVCPECGKEIPIGYLDDVLDVFNDLDEMKHWETFAYSCGDCGKDFAVEVQFKLEFEKIVP